MEHAISPDGETSDIPSDSRTVLSYYQVLFVSGCMAGDLADASEPLFYETSCGTYVPRCIYIDLEPSVIGLICLCLPAFYILFFILFVIVCYHSYILLSNPAQWLLYINE